MSYTTADLFRDIGDVPLLVWPMILLAGPAFNFAIGLICKAGEAAFRLGKGPSSNSGDAA